MKVKASRDQNAIIAVAFALEFNRPFTKEEMDALNEKHQGDQDELPSVQAHQVMSFQISPGIAVPPQAVGGVEGVTFARINPNGKPSWSFSAQNNAVTIRCTNYTRWEQVWENTQVLLSRFLTDNVVNDNSIATVGLEYDDEFYVLEPDDPTWKLDLFEPETTLLQKHIFELPCFWHSHSGYFTFSQEGGHRILNTCNLDYLRDDRQVNKVVCKTQHKVLPEETIGNLSDSMTDQLPKLINEIHEINKNIMRQLLSKRMQTQIGLMKGES